MQGNKWGIGVRSTGGGYKIPYSSCMWTRQDIIGPVLLPIWYNVCACHIPVYHYVAATVVYLVVQRIMAACVVVISCYKKITELAYF